MVQPTPQTHPPGFTRVELAVVTVLLVMTLGLLPSCAQRAHRGESRAQCSSNLKQIGLGLFMFEGAFKRLPPLMAGGTDAAGTLVDTLSKKFPLANGTPLVLILPYVEEDNLWKLMAVTGAAGPPAGTAHVPTVPVAGPACTNVVNTYVCPADPGSTDGIQEGSGFGASSYLANGQVFGNTDATTGQPGHDSPWDRGVRTSGIKDGSSNTIFFSHGYTRCGGKSGNATTPASGAVWGYYNNGFAPAGNQGPPIFMNAVLSGNANVGGGITQAFQVTPVRYNADRLCDPALPATPHSTAMVVLLGDCSTRTVETNLPPRVWWLACSPDDGAEMPAEWTQ